MELNLKDFERFGEPKTGCLRGNDQVHGVSRCPKYLDVSSSNLIRNFDHLLSQIEVDPEVAWLGKNKL